MSQRFPSLISWQLVTLTPQELAGVRYIAWEWWLDATRSGASHRVV